MPPNYSFSGKILPKVLRRAHNLSGLPAARGGVWDDIEGTLAETCQALQEIQRQIQKGEETYFEETTSHANIFKGWDAFLDVRLEAPAAVTQVRRMPADYKWMSSSSVGIPQFSALPYVSLESAQEKKKQQDSQLLQETGKRSAKETSFPGEEEEDGEEEKKTKTDGSFKKSESSLKRKERSQEEQNNEEPTPTPRRPKRSKRS